MVFQNNVLSGAAGSGTTVYAIDQSIRFNDDDSAYMYRTPSSASDRDKWTWSAWIKKGNSGQNGMLFSAPLGSSGGYLAIQYGSLDQFMLYQWTGSGYDFDVRTTQKFRDPSAWYHYVVVYDSGNAVSTERVKLYVNGQRITDLTGASSSPAYPSQNTDSYINNTVQHSIGYYIRPPGSDGLYFDGHMAEIHFLDGYAYDPSYFGEFNNSGIWIPKEYTGSYGTNGFKIDGRDSSDLGDDESGNGNDYTTSGLASNDQVSDSPTTNWCVMNPLLNNGCTYTNGNLEVAPPNNQSTHRLILGTQGILPSDTNKYYWEITYLNPDNPSSSVNMLGIGELDTGVNPASNALNQSGGYALGYNATTSNLYSSSVWTANGSPTWSGGFTAGAVYGVAYDGSTKRLYFYENNTALNSGNHFATYTGSAPLGPGASLYYSPSSSKLIFNMGNNGFTYTPPTGYVAVNTTNLGS